ncbi:phytoene desaturase family protein [Bacillus sp. FJAT-45037]|uniref:phytoene desaturase family protein n=1 Tax=Bacillus sp. FJAT-45037 TaxID=2011007 RepID=UPI000C24BA27|nr:phytoene desaturase family protein [Bacillus sp. FJAT-45037]
MKKIGIVGGGLGGLTSAILLAHAGFDVHLVEKNDHLGGKMMRHRLGSANFDFGPNTITMPDVFKRIFETTGVNPDDYVTFIKLDTHTRNHFQDGTSFDLSTNQKEMLEQLSAFEGIDVTEKFEAYKQEITRLYHLSDRYFLHRTFTNWRDYLSPSLAAALFQVKPYQTLEAFHRSFFQNEKTIQMLNRYATYIGSSPYIAPATFAMIAYLELLDGVYYIKGGNPSLAEALAKRAEELGVTITRGVEVTRLDVSKRSVSAMQLSNGQSIQVDEVIMNGDLLSVYPKLVPEKFRSHFTDKKITRHEPSISAFVILVSLNKRIDSLIHHQVYFSSDYNEEFRQLFDQKKYAHDPTIYICNSSFTDPSVSPDGDNLFILVNAPPLHHANAEMDVTQYKELIYRTLKKFDVDLTPYIIEEKVIDPTWIQDTFYSYLGSLYGPASNRKKDAFLRPANKAKDLENLYFVGGSTHPGGGSPMVTLSGENIAKVIQNKHT